MNHLERALDNQNQWWKYVVVILTALLATKFIGSIPLLVTLVKQKALGFTGNPQNAADLSAWGIDLNMGLILMLIPFMIGLFIMFFLIKTLHNRTWKEVVNGTNKIRWNRFFFSMGIWFLLMGISLIINYLLHPQDYIFQFNLSKFIPSLIIIILLIPFQTMFEEFAFRGYLAQGLAAWTRSRWVVLIVPAVLFGMMHILNPEVKEYGFWLTMPQYIIFGLVFGLITILDDGLEAAMGAHAANNMFLCLFVTSKNSALQTYAVFEQTNIVPSITNTLEIILVGGFLILILAYKYKWNFSVLNKRVETSQCVF